ncbi:LysR substrate-binding domain-containing protein [Okibacterium endophyticum]
MLTLDQLRAFVAVAEELHFGRAAERLRITQPPLSRQIQKLELTIGAHLFVRSNRAVTLTAAGEALIDEARRLLTLAESAPELAKRAAQGITGHLSIGFTATAALGLLGQLLRELDDHLPDVETVLREHVSGRQADQLLDGRLDLGLVRIAPMGEQFQSRVVHRERLVAAIPSGDALAHRMDPIPPHDFEGRSVIGYSRTSAGYFDDLVGAVLAGVSTRSLERVSQVPSILALVAAGRGVAFVPQSATRLHPEGIVFRDMVGWNDPVVQLRAVWRTDSANPALRRALAVLPVMRGA